MTNDENQDSAQLTDEALLAFLDAGPPQSHRPNSGDASLTTEMPGRDEEVDEVSKPGCLSAERCMQVVLGNAVGEEAEAALAHAAHCPACGSMLANCLETLQGSPSPEEAAAIEELAAARIDWQRDLARKLADSSARPKPGFGGPGRHWMAAGAIAAGLVLVAGAILWLRQANTPERQLAKAYEESRHLELRIPEAGFAALSAGAHTRGAGGGNEPAALLEARARLAKDLERAPQDARLEQLQARADVLEERYDSAADVLDRLLAAGPVTSELLTDAASAYYQRGLASGSELDRSTALEYLRRADELAPTDPVVLFNEAIVMEDRGQMMNAVEVWNRYITVERDPKWAAEGKRKLAALEQTLNRLKSHDSRINRMLATPEAMNALAGDQKTLAALDEELSTYKLDKVLLTAYPRSTDPSGASHPPRGSPCDSSCQAARKLLKAIASSLELQHHDYWLTDLLSPDIDSLPPATAAHYAQALQLLAEALGGELTGSPVKGGEMALHARQLFQQLKMEGRSNAPLISAAQVGAERAAVNYMISLQAQVDFKACRTFAQHLRAARQAGDSLSRYPWIEAVEQITEKVCDDTPETRLTGRNLVLAAWHLAETDHYSLLMARLRMRQADDAQNSGDDETALRISLATLRQLASTDVPIFRILFTVSNLAYIEEESPRPHVGELSIRELLAWGEPVQRKELTMSQRLHLARAEMRIGAMKEAKQQLDLVRRMPRTSESSEIADKIFVEPEIFLSDSLLERGDLADAEETLDRAAAHMNGYSDSWGLRTYASARGQLQLAKGQLDEASRTLESEIRSSEGKNVRGGDQATSAEYAKLDHDLYAELVATWLKQGRSPASILALWERFRLRSRGLPIAQCQGGLLDCDQPRLLTAEHALGNSILMGQILLLDRVLIYRVDSSSITWTEKQLHRRDVTDAAQTLERAVSSPYTSPETAAKLSSSLSNTLLPALWTTGPMHNSGIPSDASLLLEADPMLQNLSWPVMPTPNGPLGLEYPLAELRSILADDIKPVDANPINAKQDKAGHELAFSYKERALVVGASVVSGGEPPLPEAITEARSVNQFLPSSELLIGKEATAASIAEGLGSAEIFHFAGHAIQTKDGTELLLASASPADKTPWVDGAFLRLHPPRVCRMAVLSACATGARRDSWNHPLQDIVETLGALGVPQVVATRWQIDSEASVLFMNHFYENLAKGKSVSLALTSARRVLSSQSLYKNPYYWGAYYSTGREMNRSTGELHASR